MGRAARWARYRWRSATRAGFPTATTPTAIPGLIGGAVGGLLRLAGRQGSSCGVRIVWHWRQPSSGTSIVVRACRFPVQAALDVELFDIAVLSSSASRQSSRGGRCPISSVRSTVACQPVLQVMRRAFAIVVHRRLISGCSGTVAVGDGCCGRRSLRGWSCKEG